MKYKTLKTQAKTLDWISKTRQLSQLTSLFSGSKANSKTSLFMSKLELKFLFDLAICMYLVHCLWVIGILSSSHLPNLP